ncbi:MAG: hypothetical protein HY924_04795 [Elusimicrobia bacterium]|nr:hypothetical protein [Elusimicrobiota bacterium]
MALLGDVYFYISAFGFAASCALFGFFLRQYRLAAAQAGDEHDVEPVELPKVVPLISESEPKLSVSAVLEPEKPAVPFVPEPSPAAKSVPAPAAKPEPQPSLQAALAALPPAGPAVPRPKSETTWPGGISPAIVYLQSVKSQLELLEKEVGNLKSLAAKQTSQEELILKKLGELSEQLKSGRPSQTTTQPRVSPTPAPAQPKPVTKPPEAAPAPAPAPAPSPAKPVVTLPPITTPPVASAPEPVASPAPQSPVPEPLISLPPQTPEVVVTAPAPQPVVEAAPAPAIQPLADEKPGGPAPIVLEGIPEQAGAAQPESKPSRKGPVWPI